jgi:hypothetical protein
MSRKLKTETVAAPAKVVLTPVPQQLPEIDQHTTVLLLLLILNSVLSVILAAAIDSLATTRKTLTTTTTAAARGFGAGSFLLVCAYLLPEL